MSDKRYLYLMVSRTDTNIGRIIRVFSRYPYNHVSLSIDPSLREWVSFGRFRKDTPLYAGFIRETVERYLSNDGDTPVRLFRMAITPMKYNELKNLFENAGYGETKLIYNLYDAVASCIRVKIPIRGAYTCLSFANTVLGKRYLNIRELNEDLRPYMIYEGPLSSLVADSGQRSDRYFDNLGVLRGTWRTTKQLADLTTRPIRGYRRDVLQRTKR